jgi:hypothetical protein
MVGLLLVFSRAGFIGSPLAAVVAALLVLKYTAATCSPGVDAGGHGRGKQYTKQNKCHHNVFNNLR